MAVLFRSLGICATTSFSTLLNWFFLSVRLLSCLLLLLMTARSQAQTVNKVYLQKQGDLSSVLVYWFTDRFGKETQHRQLAPFNSEGLVTLELPDDLHRPGTMLHILDVLQHRIARYPIILLENRAKLGRNLIQNGSFTVGTEGWNIVANPPVRLQVFEEKPPKGVPGSAMRFRVTAISDVASHAQIYQTGLELQDLQSYTLIFWARADRNREISIDTQADREDYHYTGLSHSKVFLTKEWKRYEIVFTATRTTPRQDRINFVLGDSLGTVDLAGVKLQQGRTSKPLGANLLRNPNFVNQDDHWLFEGGSGNELGQLTFPTDSEVAMPPSLPGKVARCTVARLGKEDEDVSLSQPGRNLEDGEVYTVSFWAKANRSRTIKVVTLMDREDKHLVGLNNHITLTEDWRKYSLVFTATQTVTNASMISFQMGKELGAVDLAGVSMRTGAADGPIIETEAKVHTVSSGAFQLADSVRVGVELNGLPVREAKMTMEIEDYPTLEGTLNPNSQGIAKFTAIPFATPLLITVQVGNLQAQYVRTLPFGTQRSLATIVLPQNWKDKVNTIEPDKRLKSLPIVGAWESFAYRTTKQGAEYERFLFTFRTDGTGKLEVTLVKGDLTAATKPTRVENFRWGIAEGERSIVVGNTTYLWNITQIDTVEQLALKGANGKSYSLFRK